MIMKKIFLEDAGLYEEVYVVIVQATIVNHTLKSQSHHQKTCTNSEQLDTFSKCLTLRQSAYLG